MGDAYMESLDNSKNEDLKLPKDIPEGFFDIVWKVLNFVEEVDEVKNKKQ